MKFSGSRTYTRRFSSLPILFVLAHGLGSVFCIRQKAGIQKLISEGLTKEPRTRSELKYGEGRRGEGGGGGGGIARSWWKAASENSFTNDNGPFTQNEHR